MGQGPKSEGHDRKIAKAWVKHSELARGDRTSRIAARDLLWAYETVDKLVRSHPEQAWHIVKTMLGLATTDQTLADIAAGPVERLLSCHGEKFIDRIEDAAATDPKFRKMLGAVWRNSIPDDIWQRVKAVAGASF
jgi:hypothetical protein